MAQLLQHQDSAYAYGKELHGRRWGILQFFGLRRRVRSTKMLSDKKHGHGKGSGGSRRRGSYAPLKNEESGTVDEEKNDEVTKKQKASKRSSGKALGSLILRKLYGKEGQKEKMLPVAPKLLRTISIHYLESNEYVLDGKATSSVDGSLHGSTLTMQDAINTDLQHATCDTVGDFYNNTSSLLSLESENSHVKRKSHRSISMDGVLHKVPYGKKISDDVISEVLPRSASATYDRDGQKRYSGIAAKRHGFRRSRSLTESLESYSRILDAIANSESKRALTSSKSTRDRSLDASSVLSSLPRLDENLEDALTSHGNDAEEIDVHGDKEVAVDERSSDEITSTLGNIFLYDECIRDKKNDVASEVVDISKDQAAAYDDNDQNCSPIEIDFCSAPKVADILDEHTAICDMDDETQSSMQSDSCIPSSENANIAEEFTTYSHDNQMHSFHNSKPTEGTFCVPDSGHEYEADISCGQETESPMSVLDAAFSDDPASLIKCTMLDDTFLNQRISHLNDNDASTGTGDDLIGHQVDTTHKDEFNYVKEIFKKSSFSNEILYDEWYSQNITALKEEDCQHYEAAAAAFDFIDMSAEQLLLFDLTNEALLDIYKKHSVCKSRLSLSSSFHGSSKPVGHVALRELWSKLSFQLDEQPRSAVKVDTILARDLAKGDRWTSFQRDADNLANDLGDFVFRKLLTELVLELAEF